MSLIGSFHIPVCSILVIRLQHIPQNVHIANTILRIAMSLVCCITVQFTSLHQILWHTQACFIQASKTILGTEITLLRSSTIPLHCRFVIFIDSRPTFIQISQDVLRFSVPLLSYHFAAFQVSSDTPVPLEYICPNSNWEDATPCSAALWYHFAACLRSISKPRPFR